MQEISFYEQFEWSASRNAMKFWAVVDGDPVICWIDEAALNSFAEEASEEEKNVQAYFIENQTEIQEMAKRMILDKRFDEDNAVNISPDDSVSQAD